MLGMGFGTKRRIVLGNALRGGGVIKRHPDHWVTSSQLFDISFGCREDYKDRMAKRVFRPHVQKHGIFDVSIPRYPIWTILTNLILNSEISSDCHCQSMTMIDMISDCHSD